MITELNDSNLAEAVMLGQAISLVLPQVVGYKISGKLNEMCTSTDIVLAITKVIEVLSRLRINFEKKF